MKTQSVLWMIVSCVVWMGCGEDETPRSSDADAGTIDVVEVAEPACVPSASQWESVVQPMVEESCGMCHGASPRFGAPFSLTNYDAITEGAEGERVVDWMVEQVSENTMPPSGLPRPPHVTRDTIVEWASCGLEHPKHIEGLEASRPVFMVEDEADPGLDHFDLLAPDFPVGPDVLDRYQCFAFDAPVDADRFITRIEAKIDESRVLHHIVLLRDTQKQAPSDAFQCRGFPLGSEYLYAWAPGTGAVEFPEGGLRVSPDDRFVIQIHYNNGAGIPDARDSTGVRMYHAEPAGPEYGMFSPGPLVFSVPAGETRTISGHCRVSQDMELLAGMPHMHEIGSSFAQEVTRAADDSREEIVSLTGWSFELQHFYHTPMRLEADDVISTHCVFENPTDGTVRSGEKTSDEMCFNFMYVTPPPPSQFCDNAADPDAPPELTYTPGACAPTPGVAEPGEVVGELVFGPVPELTGGALTDGLYVLTGYNQLLTENDTPIGPLDTEATTLRAKGQLEIVDGRLAFDNTSALDLVFASGVAFDNVSNNSFAGTWAEGAAGELVVTPDCGGSSENRFGYEVSGDTITLGFVIEEGITLYPRLTFTRVSQ